MLRSNGEIINECLVCSFIYYRRFHHMAMVLQQKITRLKALCRKNTNTK